MQLKGQALALEGGRLPQGTCGLRCFQHKRPSLRLQDDGLSLYCIKIQLLANPTKKAQR